MPALTIAPAVTWRAFFVYVLLGATMAGAGPAPGVTQPPGVYVQIGKPDQEEGRRVLAQFRQAGIAAGQYYLEFDLRVLPRRGDERLFHGRLWGGRNEQGAIMRMSVAGAAGIERRLVIQNGAQASVWSNDRGSGTPCLVESLEPLIPGVELTAFELQMPYIYWPDATLESVSRVRSRPAHVFLFRPPADWADRHPEFSGVRAYLDTQFGAPVQSELLGPDGRVVRTLTLVDLKKIGDQYLPKTIDLRNEVTRDKTRFQVTGISLGLDFSGAVFEPAQLNEDISPPAAGKIVRIAP